MPKRIIQISLLWLLLPPVSFVKAESLATLYSAQGRIEGQFQAGSTWVPVATGQNFQQNDTVRTGENSRAGVRFEDGFLIRLAQKTSLTFRPRNEAASPVSLLAGTTHFLSRKSREFPTVQTPHISASVRGTEFVVSVSDISTTVSVLDGNVAVENTFGTVTLSKGEQAVAQVGRAPVKQILVNPIDAVQWALYYPPSIDIAYFEEDFKNSALEDSFAALRAGRLEEARNGFSGGEVLSALGRSLVSYAEGDYGSALSTLQLINEKENGKIQLFKSSLYLALGVPEAAESIHAKLLTGSTPSKETEANIASQKALIRLVQNNPKEAESILQPYLSADVVSDSVYIVASYIAQSQFRLDDAKAHLVNLLKQTPEHELAIARLSELHLGFGDRKAALQLLGVESDLKSAYGFAVLGFSHLTERNLADARRAFEKAVEIDQSFGLARLGLGLVFISEGSLEAGRTELQYAVQLDPVNSLYRSYLGKAYYEEQEGGKAAQEFTRAMELDPQDPTPYLYRSFLHLTEHRPIPALRDVQASIERNDNRAVYRSRLMLENDSATRTSSLGQIYNRVGFTELARLEAIKSLNKDYSNYSAHFLLADVYSQIHLNSRAQASENLLGRLLSPVTFNANNINIGGEASLNEYNTLFEAPDSRIGIQGRANSALKRAGGTLEHTSVTENIGHNIGYAYDYQGGFRENDFEKNHQLFSLGQLRAGADTTVVWDGALTANDQGDVVVNYDPYAENKNLEAELDSALLRSGIHHRISPGTHFVAQAFYNYGDTEVRNGANTSRLTQLSVLESGELVTRDPFPFDGNVVEDSKRKQHLGQLDAQFIIDRELVSVIAGSSVRYDSINANESSTVTSSGTSPELDFVVGFPLASDATIDQLTHRTFLYTKWHITNALDVDLGGTYTFIDFSDNALNAPYVDEGYDKDELSPKVGMTYELTPTTYLRAAYGRTLDRTDRGNIGPLEPTFIGGFNQVFDGIAGSKQEFWGAGFDHSFPTETFVGVNYQRRRISLNNPFVAAGLAFERTTSALSEDRFSETTLGRADEDRIAVYGYQILSDKFTLSLDYVWEHFDETDPLPELDTGRVASQLNYFHSSGLFTLARGSFRKQKRASGFEAEEENDFFILDLGLGLEFDNRRGGISLVLQNVLDKEFKYSATRDEDLVLPEFGAVLQASYSF